jgi:polyisoprenoid-binding protein YceI
MTAAAAIGLAGAPPADAEPFMLTLDAQRTTIQWVLRGFPDTVHGTFRLERGVLRFEADSGAADGCFRVDARSGESGNATRDRKMHDQVLETARYPEVTLRPTRVEGALPTDGDGTLRMEGLLSLHGVEHPVILPVRVTRQGTNVTADAALTIPYVAWGLADPSVFVFRARKTVDLELHAVGVVTPAATPAALRPLSCGP